MRQCKHPCPGCGKTDYWGNKGTLCSDCKDALKVGVEVMTARKLKKDAPVGPFSIPWASYAFPYFSHGENYHRKYFVEVDGEDCEGHAKENFCRMLYRLIGLVSEPSHDYEPPILIKSEGPQLHDQGKTVPVRMRKDVAYCISEIYRAVSGIAENAFNEGHKHGEDLLVRLARGEMSVKDFNQRSIQQGKKGEKGDE